VGGILLQPPTRTPLPSLLRVWHSQTGLPAITEESKDTRRSSSKSGSRTRAEMDAMQREMEELQKKLGEKTLRYAAHIE